VRGLLFAFAVCLSTAMPTLAASVNVYSDREPDLIKPLLEAFTKETGIEVNFLYAKDGLIERMQAEGPNSPADRFPDARVRIADAVKKPWRTAPIRHRELAGAIPATLRDPEATGSR